MYLKNKIKANSLRHISLRLAEAVYLFYKTIHCIPRLSVQPAYKYLI